MTDELTPTPPAQAWMRYVVQEYGSITAAAEALKVSRSTVRRVMETGQASQKTVTSLMDNLFPGDDSDLPFTY